MMKRKVWFLIMLLMVLMVSAIHAAEPSEGTIEDLKNVIANLEDEGEFANPGAARSLRVHLTSVEVFEQKEDGEKVVQHMKGFNMLVDNQLEKDWISEQSHSLISTHADEVRKRWDLLPIVQEGQANATIVLAADASAVEQQAGNEIQDYIEQISGVELPVVSQEDEVVGVKISIGRAVEAPNTDAILAGGNDPAAFQLLVTEEGIELIGLSDQGTLYAAYELLEQLGVRWFMPGELGTVVPTSDIITIPIQDTIEHPGFSTRRLQHIMNQEEWVTHNRLGGEDFGIHGFPCAITSQERPDLYIQVDGKPTTQYDVAKQEVLDCVVEGALAQLAENPDLNYISMGPRDGGGFGASEWDADDMDPMQGGVSHTDRYIKFYNLVIEELEKAGYEDVGVAAYIYSRYIRPPVREVPNEKFLPIFAPITTERIHSIDNPLSWERQYLKDIYDGWAEFGLDLMYRGYLFNLADPGLPFTMIDQVATEFKYYGDNGFERMRVESGTNWGYHGPSLYLAAKMMWDPDLNVQAVLNDYFAKFYGPAGEAMQNHFERLEKAFYEADFFAGSIYDFQHILTPEVLQELEQSLSEAETLASHADDSVYADRINMTRIGFDYGKTFMNMIESINSFDFITAKEQYDTIASLAVEAMDHEPTIISRGAWNHAVRFYEDMVNQAYERVTNGNQIVAKFPDEWHVMLDPLGGGEQIGLWKPTLGTESWMKLKTFSRTWSAQGLRYYKGNAWYRTTIDVPAEFEDRDIRLWISSLDQSARVWINGKELPMTIEGRAIGVPWEFDASEAIVAGQPNVVVIDISKQGLAELGTGGIMGPVMLYDLVYTPEPVLLQNPGFEEPGPAGWNLGSGKLDENVVYSGNYSASLLYESDAAFNAISSSSISVTAGEKYLLSGWVKNDSTQGNASLGVRYADSNNSTIRYDFQASNKGSDWTHYELSIEVPENAVRMSVYFTMNSNANGNAWLDDVELTKVSEE